MEHSSIIAQNIDGFRRLTSCHCRDSFVAIGEEKVWLFLGIPSLSKHGIWHMETLDMEPECKKKKLIYCTQDFRGKYLARKTHELGKFDLQLPIPLYQLCIGPRKNLNSWDSSDSFV